MRQDGGLGRLPHEALWVYGVGGHEYLLPGVTHRCGPSVVHDGLRHQPDARVAMPDAPGVSQIAVELGMGANVLGHWRQGLDQEPAPALVAGTDRGMRTWPSCGGSEPAAPRSGIFCEKQQRSSRARRDNVSDDPMLAAIPIALPVFLSSLCRDGWATARAVCRSRWEMCRAESA